jgi:hypothetical protein
VVGAKLAEGSNTVVVDPATGVLFPFEVTYDGGVMTLLNDTGFAIEFNAFRIPFQFFRLAGRLDEFGAADGGLALNVGAICAGINFYGPFLQQLGFCNPQTDILSVFGGAELTPIGSGLQGPQGDVGSVDFVATHTDVTATLTGGFVRTDEHSVSLLLVDDATGKALPIDYGFVTMRTTDDVGFIQTVSVPFGNVAPPPTIRAYLMVNSYPGARATLAVP